MGDDAAFELAIREAPDVEITRLVYADWLEERGDARSEFLRLESQLRRMSESAPQYKTLQRRLGVLAKQRDVRWVAALCRIHMEIDEPTMRPERCPLTAAGPFYTCGQCLACEAPEVEAPDLLAPLGVHNQTTYFVRQPETSSEIERACSAMQVCCVGDLRYGGTDPKIITMLARYSAPLI